MNELTHELVAQDGDGSVVLVTGGCGYIGSILVRRLLRSGYQVRVVDHLLYGGHESLGSVMDHPRLVLMKRDITESGVLEKAVEEVDTVVHMAAIVGDPGCAMYPELAIEVNQRATERLVDLVRDHKNSPRFVFASTCSVYGSSDDTMKEDSPLNPISLYALTKARAEEAILSRLGDNGCPVILRFATMYGLSPRPRFDLVVNLLAAQAATNGAITIFGGEQWRPFIHASDAAAALHAFVEAKEEKVRGQIFNVGSDQQNHQIKEIGDMILRYLPNTAMSVREHDIDLRNYFVSFDKLADAIELDPKYTVRDGIEEIRDAVRSGQIKDYENTRYHNLRSLQAVHEGAILRSRTSG